MVEFENGACEPEVGCMLDSVVLVEFVIAKGALLELDIVDIVLVCSVDVVLLLIADMVLLNELEETTELEEAVPTGVAEVVELPIVN